MAQDTWLSDLLAARPVLALDVDQLTLTTDTYTVQMIDEKTANPDRAPGAASRPRRRRCADCAGGLDSG